jgi:hypothetical protein
MPAIHPTQGRDQGAKRGDERAGPGVDHRLGDRHQPGSLAEAALDRREQQRVERHAVGRREQCRPEAGRLRQRGAERPVGERVLLREERGVALQEREIDQANEQGEDEDARERMSGDAARQRRVFGALLALIPLHRTCPRFRPAARSSVPAGPAPARRP